MFKNLILALAIFSSPQLFAEDINYKYRDHIVHGPFENKIYQNSEIYFSRSQDENHPIYMIMDSYRTGPDRNEIIIDKYDIAASPPSIESVFFHNIKNKKNIIVIVSWEINSRGIGTYGKLYQIFSYENINDRIISNDLVKFDSRMSGLDGYQDGEISVFKLKNAQDVKKYIDENL